MTGKINGAFAALLFSLGYIIGQEEDFYSRFGIRFYRGSIFAHSVDVENTKGSRPFAIEFDYSKRLQGEKIWNTCRCYPTVGFIGGYTNYDNEILGMGAHLGYFVQYHFIQRSWISPAIRALGGFSYNNRPNHETKNPLNQSYSLPVNFAIQLACLLEMRLHEKLTVDLSLSFNHISNGGIRQPNKGINWPSLGFGAYYTPNYQAFINRKNHIPERLNPRPWFIRATAYSSGHTETIAEKKDLFLVFGAELLGGYYINNLQSLLTGIEWNYDQARTRRIYTDELNAHAHRLSLVVGHEFILGDFRFTQKLGAYFLDDLKTSRPIYHKWGIAYLHKSGMIAGIELKAHRHIAEFVSGTVGWQF